MHSYERLLVVFVFVPAPPIGIGEGIMFSYCPFVSTCVCPYVRAQVPPRGVRPEKFVCAISYKPVDGISPNFG